MAAERHFAARRPPHKNDAATLEEERREVVESVVGTLKGFPVDKECLSACAYLLHHLASTGAG